MQKIVSHFNEKFGRDHRKPMKTHCRLLDIESEIGELGKEYLISTNYGTRDFKMSFDFKMEYGDVLYALLSLAEENKINAKECLRLALDKMEKRHKTKKDIGSL